MKGEGIVNDEPSPLLARRGVRDIKKNFAKLPLKERTGWWIKSTKIFDVEPPPRLRRYGGYRVFFLTAAATPGQADLFKLRSGGLLKPTTSLDRSSSHPSGVRFEHAT